MPKKVRSAISVARTSIFIGLALESPHRRDKVGKTFRSDEQYRNDNNEGDRWLKAKIDIEIKVQNLLLAP